MKFLVVVIVLALDRWLDARNWMHRDNWFYRVGDLLRRPMGGTVRRVLSPLLLIGLPVLLLLYLYQPLHGLAYGLPELLLSVLLLLYGLGRAHAEGQLTVYLEHWSSGDLQSAFLHVEASLDDPEIEAAMRGADLHKAMRERWLYRELVGLYAVIFWYCLLGPGAALAWLLCDLYHRYALEDGSLDTLETLQLLLEWLPARLMALTFMLVGNLTGVLQVLDRGKLSAGADTDEFLGWAAWGALEESERADPQADDFEAQALTEWRALRALLMRSMVMLLVALALFTIFGWQ